MKTPGDFILLAGLFLFLGCSSVRHDQLVPLPQTTPVDANPMARAAFLDAYRDGYRSASMGDNRSIDRVSGPYLFARRLGWQAGVADGARGVDPNAIEMRR